MDGDDKMHTMGNMTATQPNFQCIDEVLRWCHLPHPRAIIADMENVERYLAERIRVTLRSAADYADKGFWDRVQPMAANACDFARALEVLHRHMYDRRGLPQPTQER